MKEAGAEPDDVAKDGVKGEEENTRKGALCHARLMKMVSGLKGDEKSGADHDEAKKKRDKIFQLPNAVGEAVIGGAANGAESEKGGENTKTITELFEKIS
jgi:hypothetical protein